MITEAGLSIGKVEINRDPIFGRGLGYENVDEIDVAVRFERPFGIGKASPRVGRVSKVDVRVPVMGGVEARRDQVVPKLEGLRRHLLFLLAQPYGSKTSIARIAVCPRQTIGRVGDDLGA